ncbi:MAG: hypothetical protein ABJA20_09565 [Novosphingobium sp.]
MSTFLKVLAILMIFSGVMTAFVGYFFVGSSDFPAVLYILIPVQLIIAFGLLRVAKKLNGAGGTLDA